MSSWEINKILNDMLLKTNYIERIILINTIRIDKREKK